MNDATTNKKNAAIKIIQNHANMLVALSGGVDSAVLLHLAVEALGAANVAAATGASAAVPDRDVDDAAAVAAAVGVPLHDVETHELANPDYRANRGDRCFHCREELFVRLGALATRLGIDAIAYGAIADDLGDDRPGMRSADRRAILAPLLEAGFTKADVRAVAAAAGLSVRDKPASPCLASRIPVGTVVTAERLARIGRAAAGLHALGLRGFRVRDHAPVARVELDAAGLEAVRDDALRRRVEAAVVAAGFGSLVIDPRGYRTGGAGAVEDAGGTAPKRDGGQ